MLWLYRFIIGFLEVEFSGDIAEKILNICAKNGISLWNTKRKGAKIRCLITVRDFKALPKITVKSGIRVHILKRHGLPFIERKYKNRFGIPIGAALFFAILAFMSRFVWSVEVCGNKSVPESEIIAACNKIGIYEGISKKDIDPKNARQKLLLETDKLAWASLNIEGCRLTVNVTEMGEKVDINTPTNLKATADGIITKIDVTSGNCVVKVGDTVAKGDLLVSGILENASGTRFVHSSGSVTAKTEREITVSAQYKRKEINKTGKTNKKSVLSVFGIKIPLYLGKENKSFEAHAKVDNLSLLGKRLPIRVYTKIFEYTEEKEVTLGKKELEKELERLFYEQTELENIGDFEVKNREIDEIEGGMSLKMLISAEENIAVQEIILFNTGN